MLVRETVNLFPFLSINGLLLSERRTAMKRHRCGSMRNGVFNGEIALHFPGLDGLNKPIVWVFPKLDVCLDCGEVRFKLPESELSVLNGTSNGAEASLKPDQPRGNPLN